MSYSDITCMLWYDDSLRKQVNVVCGALGFKIFNLHPILVETAAHSCHIMATTHRFDPREHVPLE